MIKAKEEFENLCKEGEISGRVSEKTITKAERDLGVFFPAEYRDFLLTYGSVLVPGISVYGLQVKEEKEDAPPLWENVVSITNNLRNSGEISAKYLANVAFGEDGFGNYFLLDTSASPKTKIRILGPGINEVLDLGFFEFLVGFAKGDLVF